MRLPTVSGPPADVRSAGPSGRRFARVALPVVAVAVFSAGLATIFAAAGPTLGYDFQAYLHAAQRLLDGRPLYDPGVDLAGGFAIYLYPPPFALAFVPFALLPDGVALAAWLGVLAVAFVAGVALLPVRRDIRWLVLLLAGLQWPFLYTMKLGQVTPLLLFAFAAGWRWMDRPIVLAGSLAAGTAIKLQPALLFAWAVVERRWRAVALGAAALVGLAIVATSITGPGAWADYVALLRKVSSPVTTPHNFTPGAIAYQAGASEALATAIQWLSVLAVGLVTVFAWLRRDDETSYVVTVVASQLLSPLLWDHYAVVLLIPVALLLERRQWWASAIPLATWGPVWVYPVVFFATLAGSVATGRAGRRARRPPQPGRRGADRLRGQRSAVPGAILPAVTPTTSGREPACPPTPALDVVARLPARPLTAVHRPFDSIDPATWDALAARNPWATPFSRWAFHRAWWDAYGANAHDQTLVLFESGSDGAPSADAPPVAIVPLMHRHEVEPTDALVHTTMRHGSPGTLTPVAPTAKAIFFGASYHADYATVLGASDDLPSIAEAFAAHAASPPAPDDAHPAPWDVIDLRRLRCADPAADALAGAFLRREATEGWTLNVEREDVCPVITLSEGADFEAYLDTLGKKERHEIRRKLRRAEAAGEVVLAEVPDPLAELETFIELHQRRWGADGLFPPTPGGAASRVFFRRLFELFGPAGPLRLSVLTVAGRRVAAGIHFDDGERLYYYNAGVDPVARELSPGVVMVARYVARAIECGRRRLDFLRGNEPYKYEWGAVDEPIQRLLVRRAER